MSAQPRWSESYGRLAEALPRLAAAARPVLLGFSAFTDAVVPLAAAEALFAEDVPEPVHRLAEEIRTRLREGRGGEIGLAWPQGDVWFLERLEHRIGAGGTSLQIANALAPAGVPCLLALGDRSETQLVVAHGAILLAGDGGPQRVDACPRHNATAKARHWIFEASAGSTVAGIAVRRSTRLIVRLADDAPEHDPRFEALSARLAPSCGGAIISSLLATPDHLLDDAFAMVGRLAKAWRAAGVRFIHLEFADYGARRRMAACLLAALHGAVTSVGMSLSEWQSQVGAPLTADALLAFAQRHALTRVCVHADEWATSVVLGDREEERRALMAGSLFAATRAFAGVPVVPTACPSGVHFAEVAADCDLADGWAQVTVPSPYRADPVSTIGLGDTFVAGCLLVYAGGAPGAARST